MTTPREYPATVVRVIDGDTVVLRVDVGFRSSYEDTFRLVHCNAVEGKLTPAAMKVRDLLPTGKVVTVVTFKPEKYGRWLCDLRWDGCQSLVQLLIDQGYAVKYDGGTR